MDNSIPRKKVGGTVCLVCCTSNSYKDKHVSFPQKASEISIQSATYSQYKSRGIVGITPNGFVSFINDLYPGRISEKEIISQSGIFSKLEPGDSNMADRGFTIAEKVHVINAELNIPPFLNRAPQLTVADEELKRDIASVRIHVERAIYT